MTETDPTAPQTAPIAVVTGAARGLGRALATELCARGVCVAGIGRSATSLAPVTEALAEHTFLPVVADMADPDAVAAAFREVDAAFGPVEILINNAAVYPHRDILEETPGSFMDTLAINLGGPVAANHEALKRMVKTGQGRIITVTSYAGRRPAPMSAAYSVSKEAARALHRALHADLGDRFPGIILTDWIPGALNTEMGISNGLDPARVARWGAELALSRDRSLNGAIFDENREDLPPQSFKRRLFEKVTGRARRPRVLPG
ncbi:SDR family oxidoreductase [Tropicimonas sp. S265A]|uniref:SDR family oxidoreductase n=1 Tax=Tropicimonas sp. S265A TaxID=3415134 RepID=UPI003C7BBE71